MSIFNNAIDYRGQDLHMVRNGENFPLHDFFDPTLNLSYSFRLRGNEVVNANTSYENISISVTIE